MFLKQSLVYWHLYYNLFSMPTFFLFFFYQVDSVAEEVERKSSTSDMVSPSGYFLEIRREAI